MPELFECYRNGKPEYPSRSKEVVAFLQARMGSTRLPGKVLMRIQGQSILERAIRRLRASSVIDEVAVLTTHRSEDDVLVEECARLGVWVYRGPSEDVLARFYEAAQVFRPEIVIRATADNPLIEIGSVERIVAALRAFDLDLCMEKDLPYGAATEALTARALAQVHRLATEPPHREHVTLYMKDHEEAFNVSYLTPPDSVRLPEIRLTVDTREDLEFVQQLVRHVSEGEVPLPLQAYLPVVPGVLRERERKAIAIS